MHDARVALDVEGELATTEAGIRLEEAGMDVFEIGREIQDLRRRIARVEADSHQPRDRAQAHLIGARPSEAGVPPGKSLVHRSHHVNVDASAAGFAIS